MKPLLIATHNAGKFQEFQAILAPIECIPAQSLKLTSPEEKGLSFIENAILKARAAATASQMPALADDSGLVVPALKGAPGIYSARYAGKDANDLNNIEKLLEQMQYLTGKDRNAYFYCALALVQYAEDPTPLIAIGQFHGLIHHTPEGFNGFGYDPIFYLKEYECTLATLPSETKNRISHRAKALIQLKKML